MNSKYKVIKYRSDNSKEVDDQISIEEPLEIILKYKNKENWIENTISITMRTPGDDRDLVTGFLFNERIIEKINHIESIKVSGDPVGQYKLYNKVIITINNPENIDIALGDRPGRFDLRVKFGYPDKELRGYILEKYLKEFETKGKLNLSKIIKETENMSGAYLKEVIMVAYMITMEYGVEVIDQKILDEAFESVKQLKREVDKSYGVRRENDKTHTLYG